LRRKVDSARRIPLLQTRRGAGYCLASPSEAGRDEATSHKNNAASPAKSARSSGKSDV
jgi:hypothetical protein